MNSFTIPQCNMAAFEKAWAALNRKAKRLGINSLAYTITGTERKVFQQGTAILCNTVQITHNHKVHVSGWTFAAVIQHEPQGNILRSLPHTQLQLPESYRTAAPNCEHCGIKRARNDTFVLFNTSTREWKQVGRTCLQDFLGGQNGEMLAQAATFLAELITFGDDFSNGSSLGSGAGAYLLEDYLAVVSALIRERGWVPKSKADFEQGILPTSQLADSVMQGRTALDCGQPTEGDCKLAEAAIQHTQLLSPQSDYEHNIQVIAKATLVHTRNMGFAASIIPFYQRYLDTLKPKPTQVSEYVGQVKQKTTFHLTVKKILTFQSAYGGFTRMYIMRDAIGNVFKWSASTGLPNEVEKGSSITLLGTIKAHEEYKGEKQTVLTRCKCVAP